MKKRIGDWFESYLGKQIWVLDPRPEDFSIGDIIQALPNICRFNGHVDQFYCPAQSERVLTADLRWVPAGDLKAGDDLLGFDEAACHLGSAGKNKRRYRPSKVMVSIPVRRRLIRLEMSDGSTVVASEEHPWLVATKASKNQTWLVSSKIASDIRSGRKRYMHKFMPTWSPGDTYDIGWLAGIYDGEGHISFLNRGGVQMGFAQLPGTVLDKSCSILMQNGIDFRVSNNTAQGKVKSVQNLGGWRGVARTLGILRPVRLLEKMTSAIKSGEMDKEMRGSGDPLEIVASYDEGYGWCAGLETSTKTYICEGYGAHNSSARHMVRV